MSTEISVNDESKFPNDTERSMLDMVAVDFADAANLAEILSENSPAQLEMQKIALDEHAIVSITDNGGRIVYANNRFCKISGYSLNELVGSSHRIVKSNEHDEAFYKDLWSTITSGNIWRGIIKNRKKGGGWYWVNSTIVPYFSEDGSIDKYVSIRTDITAHVELSEELVKAKADAEAALDSKSQFLACMSHEIRTPMTHILGFVDLLQDDVLNSSSREKIEKIGRSAKSLLTIINDILDLAKIDSGKLEVEHAEFAPSEIANDVVDLFQNASAASAKGNLQINTEISGDFPTRAIAPASRLRQILVNLMGNAVKFTDKGSITLCCGKLANADVMRFQVKDTGIGVSEDYKLTLFNDFVQGNTSNSQRIKGTGLGLAICKRLVQMMGGEIGFESELGKGSTFWFTLPYVCPAEDVEIVGEQSLLRQSFETPRELSILVAEDDEFNQVIVKAMLEKMGHRATFANNGVEAVEAVKADDYDLILMDQRMPELSGIDATRKIRLLPGIKGHVPIIAFTANVMEADRQSYTNAGMNDCVGKPINFEELTVAVNKVAAEAPNVIKEEQAEERLLSPVLDLEEVKARLTLPDDVIMPMLAKFVEKYSDVADRIQVQLDNDDIDAVRELGHTLKGGSGSLGLKGISELAFKIESEAKARNSQAVSKLVPTLAQKTSEVVEAIKRQGEN